MFLDFESAIIGNYMDYLKVYGLLPSCLSVEGLSKEREQR
jgi:hypothetical protein